jgi:hypothetical protein
VLNEFLTRLRFFIAGKNHAEVDEEVRFHLEQQIEQNIQAGMSPEEARRQAAVVFGGVQCVRGNAEKSDLAIGSKHLCRMCDMLSAVSGVVRCFLSP